jgi:hypothetical protein
MKEDQISRTNIINPEDMYHLKVRDLDGQYTEVDRGSSCGFCGAQNDTGTGFFAE